MSTEVVFMDRDASESRADEEEPLEEVEEESLSEEEVEWEGEHLFFIQSCQGFLPMLYLVVVAM